MIKTMIIDPDNIDRCKALLRVDNIADRLIEKTNWILWVNDSAWTLPHVVFKNRYTIVGHEEDCLIAERL